MCIRDSNNGGVTILQPYEKSGGSEWYSGTANAIYQNMKYIDSYNPEYVLILSGDHIYKMDYEVTVSYTHLDVYKRQSGIIPRAPAGIVSKFL